jgi:hypothetical protein
LARRAIVAATLPMAALITFLFMRLFGLSANLMSLGGLAIAIGMLVDGAVVVVENVVERLSLPHKDEHVKTTCPGSTRCSVPRRRDRAGVGGHRDHRHRVPAAAHAAGAGGKLLRPWR